MRGSNGGEQWCNAEVSTVPWLCTGLVVCVRACVYVCSVMYESLHLPD